MRVPPSVRYVKVETYKPSSRKKKECAGCGWVFWDERGWKIETSRQNDEPKGVVDVQYVCSKCSPFGKDAASFARPPSRNQDHPNTLCEACHHQRTDPKWSYYGTKLCETCCKAINALNSFIPKDKNSVDPIIHGKAIDDRSAFVTLVVDPQDTPDDQLTALRSRWRRCRDWWANNRFGI